MKYLLDTCLISELVRKKPEPKVVAWVQDCDEDHLHLSVLTLGEIQKEIAKLPLTKRSDRLQHWLDKDLTLRFENRILPVSEDIALTWGLVQIEAERQGRPIPSIDGLLGATAVACNLTVVTRNEADIALTGARTVNPWVL